jgi:hypothetical protein
MPILNIRDMGTVGVNSDVAPWELPPSALSYGYNFRMSSGKIQSAGGVSPVGDPIGDVIGHLTPTKDYNQNASWLACGANDIFMWYQDKWVSIKGGVSFNNLDPVLWSSCSIGNVTFLNHPDYFPVYFVNEGVPASIQLLPWHVGSETWQDKDYSCRVICSHKNFLFALGMKEAGDEYRDKVCWSHPAEPNGIPFSWRPTSEQRDSIAGNVNLGRGGAIVGGESQRDSFVIYSEEAINTLDFVGDALGWRRRTVSTSADLIGKEALVEVKGMHYFISNNDIMQFDGNTMQSLIHNRLKRQLASNINMDAVYTSWAAHNQAFNEIWFAVPTSEAYYPDLAYVFNYRDNTWAARWLEKEMMHGEFGEQPFADDRTWDTMVGEYDQDRGSWAMGGERPFRGIMVGCSGDQVYDIDPGFRDTEFNDEVIGKETILSRVDIPIGGHEANTTITRIYPLVEGSSPIQIRVGSAQMAGGPVRWAGGFRTFVPGVDRKIDVRTTGETHAFEIRSSGMAFFDLTGMDIEFSPAGGR